MQSGSYTILLCLSKDRVTACVQVEAAALEKDITVLWAVFDKKYYRRVGDSFKRLRGTSVASPVMLS